MKLAWHELQAVRSARWAVWIRRRACCGSRRKRA